MYLANHTSNFLPVLVLKPQAKLARQQLGNYTALELARKQGSVHHTPSPSMTQLKLAATQMYI
ncbi:hypothetical protein PTI98_004884 [Pleurotus ostreatus]|nr:hypothetical protein PTI98_004884 [Pleurotus ostreatus]